MRRGFTLIELLTAITIGAVLLLMTAHVFSTALDGRARLEAKGAELAALRRAYETISRDMHSATVPPDDSGLQFGLSATGAGAATNVLQFASVVGEPLLTARAATETALIQYAIAEDPTTGQPALWRYETPYPVQEGLTPGQGDDTRSLPLLRGVNAASYLFYSETQGTWVESWDGETGLPTAIRIDLELREGANGGAPEGVEEDRDAEPRLESWVFTLPARGPAESALDEAAETEL